MKKIKNKKKILIAVAVVAVMLLAYYIYYKNSDTYKEFEESSQLEELIPYEEEKQEDKSKSNSKSNQKAESEESENGNGGKDVSNGNGDTEANSNSNGETSNKGVNNGEGGDTNGEEKGADSNGENSSSGSTNEENSGNGSTSGTNSNGGGTENRGEMMLVHITGEVKNWGVIELPEGSRVIDAVNKAGGFTDSADIEKVNLAYELSDGVKVYIPSKNEDEIGDTTTQEYITADSGNNVITGGNDMKKETKSELVNINKATQTELETLPGIGPSTALKIISYRNENGSFSSIEDIKNVNGIGDSKYESIRELICV